MFFSHYLPIYSIKGREKRKRQKGKKVKKERDGK